MENILLNFSLVPFVKRRELRNEVSLQDETDQQEYIERIDKTWSGAINESLLKGKGRPIF